MKDDAHESRSVSNVLLDVRFAIFDFGIFNFGLSIGRRCPLNRPCGLRAARLDNCAKCSKNFENINPIFSPLDAGIKHF